MLGVTPEFDAHPAAASAEAHAAIPTSRESLSIALRLLNERVGGSKAPLVWRLSACVPVASSGQFKQGSAPLLVSGDTRSSYAGCSN